MRTVIHVNELYEADGQAKLSHLSSYEARCVEQAEEGREVVLTGAGPIWLYLRLAHVLHGKVMVLYYDSPVTGEVEIFNHNPF
jgi:CRISPR-associated Csx3 family protein